MTLLRRSSLRYLWLHRWQTALAVLGVALGVGVVLAVDLAVSSARTGFTRSAEAIAGRATHRAEAMPGGLANEAYRRLRTAPGVIAAAPVVEGEVVGHVGDATVVLRALGIDPFAEAPFRRFSGDRGDHRVASLLIGERSALVTHETAETLGAGEGDWLRLTAVGRTDSVRVAGLLEPEEQAARLGLGNLLVLDIGTAQALLGRGGLDRVDLILDQEAVPGRLAEAAGPGATLTPAGAAADALREMTRSFDLNLRALSLLGLIFGVFLIYNSVTFSVVQRRRLLGTLRALGASRRQVFGLVLTEAGLLGVAGSVLGLLLGQALGRGLVRLVTRTIEDLYFTVAVRDVVLAPSSLALAAGLGIAGTLVAAVPPALEAATTHPRTALLRSDLEAGLRRRLPVLTAVGLGLAGAGLAVLAVSRSVDASLGGLFGVILGAGLVTPMATVWVMRILRPVAGAVLGVLGRMAATGVSTGLSRTAPAMAALTVAVAVTVGIAIMIGSFRGSVVAWLDTTLSADIYISPVRPGGGASAFIDGSAVSVLAGDPAVAEARPYREVRLMTERGPLDLMAIGVDSRLRAHFMFLGGEPAGAWDDFAAGRALLLSEPLAYRWRVGVGDTLRVRTPGGPEAMPVAGIFRDYGSDRGLAMISHEGYRRRWDDTVVTTMALILHPGQDREAVMERLGLASAGIQPLNIRSNHRLAEVSMTVFDRTFAITRVLRLLALIVAFVGVLSALMALQLERSREFGVLRANGLTPGQVWIMVTSQTGLMGLAAGLMALPLGLALAVLMVEFVNRRSFGWSIDLTAPPSVLLQAVGLAVGASLLAGLYPAWRMARTSPAEALRSE
jgi:putative ABC transport system permease protein